MAATRKRTPARKPSPAKKRQPARAGQSRWLIDRDKSSNGNRYGSELNEPYTFHATEKTAVESLKEDVVEYGGPAKLLKQVGDDFICWVKADIETTFVKTGGKK